MTAAKHQPVTSAAPAARSSVRGGAHHRGGGGPTARSGRTRGHRSDHARPTARRRAWWRRAVCRHADPTLFFPEPDDHATIAQAVAVCRACPVIEACLADALDRRERHGIRGGLTAGQRRKLLAGRRRTAHNYGQDRTARRSSHQAARRTTARGFATAIGGRR